MPSIGKTSIYTASQIAEMEAAMVKLKDMKNLCEKAGKCNLPMDQFMTEIEFMLDTLEKLHMEFVKGHKPAAEQAATAKKGG